MQLTILTPTYNRRHTLPALYQSLCAQGRVDFEWLIVDDGSTDDTQSWVRECRAQATFPVRLLVQANGGKHVALNTGVAAAQGEWVFIVDSDDRVTPDAVDQILSVLPQSVSGPVGICFRKEGVDGRLVGRAMTGVPSPFIGVPSQVGRMVVGDLAYVFRRDIMARSPFPVIPTETFVPELYIWNQIADEGPIWFYLDRAIYQCEYRSDGYTRNFQAHLRRSPGGFLLFYAAQIGRERRWRDKIKAMIRCAQCVFYSALKASSAAAAAAAGTSNGAAASVEGATDQPDTVNPRLGPDAPVAAVRSIALVSHHAVDMLNFRGHLIGELVAAGLHVHCLAPDYDAQGREAVRALGAQPIDYGLQRHGMNPWRDLVDMLRLARALRGLAPDVSFAFSTKPMVYGTLAAYLARIRRRVALVEGAGYVFTASGEPPGWRRRSLRGVVEALYRLALGRAHRVIFLNPDDQREFIARGLVAQDRSVLLGGIGVDLRVWQTAPTVSKPMCFLLVARLLREKGIVEFATAARRLKADHPGARFVLLGRIDTNPGGLPQAQVRAWVDEGILEWPGHVPVQPWLRQASVFVLPSYREGVPLSTQEAMAMGRPVITTDVPGCRETVRDGVNGYRIPPRDVEALEGAMRKFLVDPDQVAIMGAASRRIAEECFDVEKVDKKLLTWLVG